jgi:hypothetical protein
MEIITPPTDGEIIGLLILIGLMLSGLFICWLKYGRNDRRASDGWTRRHIDDRGNYRP